MSKKKNNRNKEKYLNKTLQHKYLLLIMISVLMPTLFVGACLYYLIFAMLADQILLPDFIARDLFPIIKQINIILAIGLPVVFFAIFIWAYILSYKFIAPLERLEADLRKIDEGDYSVKLKVEKDHDLKPIADVINDLVKKLKKAGGV